MIKSYARNFYVILYYFKKTVTNPGKNRAKKRCEIDQKVENLRRLLIEEELLEEEDQEKVIELS